MQPRIDQTKVSTGALRAMLGLERYLHDCGLPQKLLDLVRLRVSQINGCAYCLDMHSKDLRAAGESEQRLYLLHAWRETPFIPTASRRPSHGRKPSPMSLRTMSPTKITSKPAASSPRKNW